MTVQESPVKNNRLVQPLSKDKVMPFSNISLYTSKSANPVAEVSCRGHFYMKMNTYLNMLCAVCSFSYSAVCLVPGPTSFNVKDVHTGQVSLEEVEERLTHLEKRVSGLPSSASSDADNMNTRTDEMEHDLTLVRTEVSKVNTLVKDMERSLAELENTVQILVDQKETDVVEDPKKITDVAVSKPTTQSSTYHYGVNTDSKNAVDPGTQSDFRASACSATGDDSQQTHWWQVDLLDSFNIEYVEITPRSDVVGTQYANDLRNFVIEVFAEDPQTSTDSGGHVCRSHPGALTSGMTHKLACIDQPITGRYVRITKHPGFYGLTLCKVAVFAHS